VTDRSNKPSQRRPGGIAGHVRPERPVTIAGIRTTRETNRMSIFERFRLLTSEGECTAARPLPGRGFDDGPKNCEFQGEHVGRGFNSITQFPPAKANPEGDRYDAIAEATRFQFGGRDASARPSLDGWKFGPAVLALQFVRREKEGQTCQEYGESCSASHDRFAGDNGGI
jgi:hypothetical protein